MQLKTSQECYKYLFCIMKTILNKCTVSVEGYILKFNIILQHNSLSITGDQRDIQVVK